MPYQRNLFVLALLCLSFAITSCGVAETVDCNGDLKSACRLVFGGYSDEKQDERLQTHADILSRQQRSIRQLEGLFIFNLTLYANLAKKFEEHQEFLELLQAKLNLQQQVIAELQTNETIEGFIDPCGDEPGHYDEVVMVTSSGKWIAYFEDGGKRFLTILEPGKQYITTDKQRCSFYAR